MIKTLLLYDGKMSSAERIAAQLSCMIGNARAAEIGDAPASLAPYGGFCFVFNYYGAVTAGRTRAFLREHQAELREKRIAMVGIGFSDLGYTMFVTETEKIAGLTDIAAIFISGEAETPRVGHELYKMMRVADRPLEEARLLAEIESYIAARNTLALATSGDGYVRCTPLEYHYRDGAFYIVTEGGSKFRGILENGTAAAAIFDPYTAMNAVRGLQFLAKAVVIPDGSDEYQEVLAENGVTAEALEAQDVTLFLLKLLPLRYEYLNADFRARGLDVNQTLETEFLRENWEMGARYANAAQKAEQTNEEAAKRLRAKMEDSVDDDLAGVSAADGDLDDTDSDAGVSADGGDFDDIDSDAGVSADGGDFDDIDSDAEVEMPEEVIDAETVEELADGGLADGVTGGAVASAEAGLNDGLETASFAESEKITNGGTADGVTGGAAASAGAEKAVGTGAVTSEVGIKEFVDVYAKGSGAERGAVIESRFAPLAAESSDVEAELSDTEAELSGVEAGSSDVEAELPNAVVKLSGAEAELPNVAVKLSGAAEESSDAEAKLSDAAVELFRAEAESSDAKAELPDAAVKLSGAAEESSDAKAELPNAVVKLSGAEAGSSDAEAELPNAVVKLSGAAVESSDAKAEISDAQVELPNAAVKPSDFAGIPETFDGDSPLAPEFRMPSFIQAYVGENGQSRPLPEIDMSVIAGLEEGRRTFYESDREKRQRMTVRKKPVTLTDPDAGQDELAEELEDEDSPVYDDALGGISGTTRKKPAEEPKKERSAAKEGGFLLKLKTTLKRMLLIDGEDGDVEDDEDDLGELLEEEETPQRGPSERETPQRSWSEDFDRNPDEDFDEYDDEEEREGDREDEEDETETDRRVRRSEVSSSRRAKRSGTAASKRRRRTGRRGNRDRTARTERTERSRKSGRTSQRASENRFYRFRDDEDEFEDELEDDYSNASREDFSEAANDFADSGEFSDNLDPDYDFDDPE